MAELSSSWRMPQLEELKVYPIKRNWSRVFKPTLIEVRQTLRRAIRTIRNDFDPTIHIPREAGWCLDSPWPRTRSCARAYHMYGYCHVISVVVLDMARRALPKHDWAVVSAQCHSAVYSSDGYILDLVASHDDPNDVRERNIRDTLLAPSAVWTEIDEHIDYLETYPFGEPTPMPHWAPRKGAA